MKTITWIRPSGRELVTNDSVETIEYAEGLGWERADKPEEEVAEEEEPEKESTGEASIDKVNPGDRGTGVPGSFEFTEAEILGCKFKKPIINLIKNLYKKNISDDMTVAKIQEQALKIHKDNYDDGKG